VFADNARTLDPFDLALGRWMIHSRETSCRRLEPTFEMRTWYAKR
jgi:hypothetical protein